MAKFMLILHNTPGNLGKGVARGNAAEGGKISSLDREDPLERPVRASEKLGEEGGKLLGLQKGRLNVVDGPYGETKEVVGGYFVFRAADYDEAIELTRDCPFLDDGRIELRQTDPRGCGGE